MPDNNLMRGAKRAIDAGLGAVGRATKQLRQFFDEITSEELQAKVKLRDQVLKMGGTEEFKAFHADAVHRIKGNERTMKQQAVEEFNGVKGVELRGRILGQEDIFMRITSIIEEGNSAETMLAAREGARQLKKEQHTNLAT